MSAAATAMMTIMAAPMAAYVIVGVALVGGMTTGLGVGARVTTAVGVGVPVGVGVNCAVTIGLGVATAGDALFASTATAHCAVDGPYELEPAKLAVMVYSPGTGGVHLRLNRPYALLVTVPRSSVLLLGSKAVK